MKSAREIFSENLKKQLELHGMEQVILAELLDVSQSSISHWINGNKYPRIDTIEKIANIFGIEKSVLTEEPRKRKQMNLSRAIPLLGTIAAGIPILAEQNIEDYFNLDSKIKADFCLRIQGDSMINVNIMDGDIVFIHQQSDLENGEIGAILIGTNATLKRFYHSNGQVILQAENPAYEPIVLSSGDVRVMGRIVANLRQFN